jgi:isopentenyl phosphate kinase
VSCTIIKLGGSIITHEDAHDYYDADHNAQLADQLRITRDLPQIIIHGTGLVGKKPAREHDFHMTGITPPEKIEIGLAIKQDIRQLNRKLIHTLIQTSIDAVPIDAALFFDHTDSITIPEHSHHLLRTLIAHNKTPVFFGDMIPQPDGSLKVFSSDTIAMLLCRLLKPKHMFFLTAADGVLRSAPGETPDVIAHLTRDNVHEVASYESDKEDVSGGMSTKLDHAFEIASHCERCVIANGRTPNIIHTLYSGTPIGTRISSDS